MRKRLRKGQKFRILDIFNKTSLLYRKGQWSSNSPNQRGTFNNNTIYCYHGIIQYGINRYLCFSIYKQNWYDDTSDYYMIPTSELPKSTKKDKPMKKILLTHNLAYKTKNLTDKLEVITEIVKLNKKIIIDGDNIDFNNNDQFSALTTMASSILEYEGEIENFEKDLTTIIDINENFDDLNFVSRAQFIQAFKDYKRQPKPIEIKLNDDYTAKVTKDNVTVGCQTIPYAKVKEIMNAFNKLRK